MVKILFFKILNFFNLKINFLIFYIVLYINIKNN